MAFADRTLASYSYEKSNYDYYDPVLIIGAGESGLAMGFRLREKLGFDQFRIFDRQSGVGGKLSRCFCQDVRKGRPYSD